MRAPIVFRRLLWVACLAILGLWSAFAYFSESPSGQTLVAPTSSTQRPRVRRILMSRTRRISKGTRFRMSVDSSNAGKMKMGHRLELAAGSGVSKLPTPPVIQSTGVMPGKISVSAVVLKATV